MPQKPEKSQALLDLEALWGGIIPQKPAKAAKTARSNLADRKRGIEPGLPVSHHWEPTAMMLPILETTCETCGSVFRAPQPLLIMRTNPRQGARYEMAERGDFAPFQELPKHRMYREATVQACCFCFGMEDSIEAMAFQPERGQLRLFQ